MIKKRRKAVLAWILALSMVLPMISSAIPSKATDVAVPTENNYDAMTIKQILSLDKSLTWVFAGDSITHNGTWSGGRNSYSEWFEQYLYDIGRGDDSVVLTAWGGANSHDFQYYENTPDGYGAKADSGKGLENMITKYNPDVVFLKLGFNDRARKTANFVKDYKQILDGVYAEGEKNNKIPKIILLTPTPLSNENVYDDVAHPEVDEALRESTLRFRDAIKGIADEYKLTFCDLRTAFVEESARLGADYTRTFYSDSSDGSVHPNAAGQYYIFKTLSKTLGIYKEDMAIYQFKYEDILKQALYVDSTHEVTYSGEYGSTSGWEDSVTENYVWAIAGAKQMSGYEGAAIHRSLFRYLDNAMRAGSGVESCRDIRIFNFSSPDYDNGVSDLLEKYDKIMAARNYDVFLLLPEIPNVYEEGYEHSSDLVTAYRKNVVELLSKNEEKVKILWTPLASGDVKINGYIDEYAEAIRDIAKTDATLLFFDANKFMNDNMTANSSLTNNWFEEGSYISSLCAVDVARAFYTLMNNTGVSMTVLENRNLRYTTDTQAFKGNYVRDYIKADATVSGTSVTVDVSKIREKYAQVSNVKLSVLPYKGAGNYNPDIRDLTEVANVSQEGNVYSFEAPCANLYLAIYGEQDGLTYRFKDISLKVNTDATIPERKAAEPDGVYLDSLKVMSAPDFEFTKDTTEYTVDLYQYQTYARVRATAPAGLTIAVNGKTVASNALSEPIKVEDGSKIIVTVSNGEEEKTYTLTCAKPKNPDIIITEVMQDGYKNYTQTGNDNYELVEIYNASGRDLNLLDYSLGYKKDYPQNKIYTSNGSEFPYYFTGNDQGFAGYATYTGIKPITKYSIYWKDKVDQEPQEVTFPADSTMVIWIKTSPQETESARAEYGAALTYDTLCKSLEAHMGTHTLSIDIGEEKKAVVPAESQLVVAELGDMQSATLTSRVKTLPENAKQNYVLDAFSRYNNSGSYGEHGRGWLFMLKDTASFATNGAITESGDDIISAARFERITKVVNNIEQGTDKLSSVFSYNYDRGMSLVKNESVIVEDKLGMGNTSDVMGYSNLTSFGAIEYWQKPTDFGDESAPTIVDTTNHSVKKGSSVTFNFDLADDQDVRYVELYMRREGESAFTKVSKDFVLEAGVKNAGLSKDIQNVTYSYTVDNIGDQIEYYAKVVDGNNNEAAIGSETEPLAITTLREVQSYSAEEAKTYIGVKAPECKSEGYVFAGWYADEACEKAPIRSAEQVTETAYALFVPENVLSVKAQLSADALPAQTTATKADIRFVTTVDTLKYQKVGFTYDIKGKTGSMYSDIVYKTLYAMNKDGSMDPLSPKRFSLASNYFYALAITGIPSSAWDTEIAIRPYWVTLDGTTVYGVEAKKTVNQGRSECVAQIGTTVYGTLSDAVEAAKDNDVIEVLRDITIDTTFTIDKKVTITNTARSSVTLTRADSLKEAMFNITSEGGLTIACTGENTITVDGNQVEATSPMIVNEGAFELGENAGLINGKIADGTEGGYGGAFKNEKTGTAIFAGKVNGNTALSGGAVYNFGGTVTVIGGEFKNNQALSVSEPDNINLGRAGAIYTHNNGTTVIQEGVFENNTAAGRIGGGAFGGTGYSTLEITGGTFKQNKATYSKTNAYGGGAIQSAGKVTISGGTFGNNSALQGGVIYMASGNNANLNISGGTFTGNRAEGDKAVGGVIYNACDSFTITGGEFTKNYAYYRGGVMYIASDNFEQIDISGATFKENSVDGVANGYHGGGVLYVLGTTITGADKKDNRVQIRNCTFESNVAKAVEDNNATGYGGVIYNTNSYSLNIGTSTFRNNSARLGGAIYIKSNMSLNNESIFEKNTAYSCSDIYENSGTIYMNGKVVANIGLNSTSKIQANNILEEESDIEIRVINTSSISNGKSRDVVTFKDATVMEDNKKYFSLDSRHTSTHQLQFANNKATVVAK